MQPTVTDSADASAHASARETEPARAFGRYLVVERLGAGGMGVVYARLRSPSSSRERRAQARCASTGAGDATLARGSLREAQALARITHPNVVTVYDVGATGGSVFLAMELVDGQTLGAVARAGAARRGARSSRVYPRRGRRARGGARARASSTATSSRRT